MNTNLDSFPPLYLFIVPFTALALCLFGIESGAQQPTLIPERFTAFAVSTGDPRAQPIATQVEIIVNRWSTAQESQRLIRVVREKGAEALLDTLRGLKPVGTINTPGNLAYDLHFGYQERFGDGGRRIFLATDRPVSYWEAVNQPRIVNYPFTFIELRMNGKGEGDTYMVYVNRSRLDALGGFFAGLTRAVVRSRTRSATVASLVQARNIVEHRFSLRRTAMETGQPRYKGWSDTGEKP